MKYLVVIALLVACGDKYEVARLQDTETCKDCHPKHYDQWSGSMHAYASEDPVFVAMNKRGQRETNNQLGTFCVNCHAPMAVKLGLTDGTDYDPAKLDSKTKGITCYFCHNVDKVTDDHNNGLQLALDQTMRGGTSKPADTPAHDSLNDKNLMAGVSNKSTMCGSCHDIITPAGVHIERSFAEWKTTIFNNPDPIAGITCSKCHMKPSDGVIAEGNGLAVGTRIQGFHEHSFPAIDQAVTPFPQQTEQAAGIADILDNALTIIGPRPVAGGTPPGGICFDFYGQNTLSVRMDTLSVGHMFPSGASQDRRTWLEVIAYNAAGDKLWASGDLADNEDPEDRGDPYLDCIDPAHQKCTGFWDRMKKDDGTEALFFWEVASEVSNLLKPAVTIDANDPLFDHSTVAVWNLVDIGLDQSQVAKITARIRTRPFPYKVLDALVASGDLDATYAQSLKTLDSAGGTRTWTTATAGMNSSQFTKCSSNPQL